jgi:hypothetical protein
MVEDQVNEGTSMKQTACLSVDISQATQRHIPENIII